MPKYIHFLPETIDINSLSDSSSIVDETIDPTTICIITMTSARGSIGYMAP